MNYSTHLFFIFTLINFSLVSQNVGVNTTGATPNTSTILDLNTGNTFTSPNGKGLLIPNIALTSTGDVTTIGSAATSLFIYNTASASSGSTAVSPGFYYWDGAKWVAFSGNGSKDWSLTGNAGTAIATNFMGSTDAVDVIFKSAGTEVMRMGNAKTNLMVTSNGNTANTTDFLSSIANGTLNGAGFYTSNTKNGLYAKVTGSSTGNAIYAESQSTTADALVAIVTNSLSPSNAISADVTGGNGVGNAISAVSNGIPNYSTIYAQSNPTVAGTGFSTSLSNHTINAQIQGTQPYSFAIYGRVVSSPVPSAGIIGYYGANIWGTLGYKALSGNTYGSYANGTGGTANTGTGTGRLSNPAATVATNIGIGAYGDLFGGWIRGNIYGLAVKGERVSLYVDGKTIVNQPIIQLIRTDDDKTIVNYTPASATADLQIHGVAKMENGEVIITIDEQLADEFTKDEEATIIATPSGQTNGVYAELRGNQLIIKENNNGKSTVKVSWIVIGKRNIDANFLPTELNDKNFDVNLKGLMHNDNETSAQPEGLYWDGAKLNKGQAPQ